MGVWRWSNGGQQWWIVVLCAVLGKLEAWCGGGGARLKGSGSYARVKGKP